MKKRVLAMLLAAVMMMGIVPVLAENDSVTVYVSVSQYGELVESKDGEMMAYLPVSVNAGGNLDDVFREMHLVYYSGGADGYGSVFNEMYQSLSVEKMWGDTSGRVGYQVNGGTEMVMGLEHLVEDGDRIDVALYKNAWPDTESYATFDAAKKKVYEGETIELTLSVSGYDENWNIVFSPCADAIITINGVDTDVVTDEEGKATLPLEEAGNYVVSAKKSKTLVNEADPEAEPRIVPAITAPVCVAEVKVHPATTMLHHIAAMYAECNFTDMEGNLSWILADMAVYEELFSSSTYVLSKARKEEGMKLLVDFLETATKPGDLAKGIIALRSLGYDGKNLYTKNFKKVDPVAKLTALVDAKDADVTNMYTLPYVIIALGQGAEYATQEQMDYLVNAALATKSSWQSTIHPEYGYMGTDAMTPMILALAPFCEGNNDVATAVDEAIVNLKAEQREDGLINGYEGYEPASTGLAICAISAMGEDAQMVTNGGENLIEGLLSCVNENQNGFSNAFATEQGFRGLLAWKLLAEETGKIMYDFADTDTKEANVAGAVKCPVVFDVTPALAGVTVEGQTEILKNTFDLGAGTYSYSIKATGFASASGIITISEDEVAARAPKIIQVSLTQISGEMNGIPSGPVDGGVSGGAVGGGSPGAVQSGTSSQVQPGQKPAEMVLTGTTFPDVKETDWYFTAVKYVYENSLFKGTDHGFEPESPMSRAMLVTVLHRFAAPKETAKQNPFADVPENQWYTEGIKWAAENGIVSGVSEDIFEPDAGITREQLALILYRYAMFCGYETESIALAGFADSNAISDYAIEAVSYAVAKGIITGKTESTLAPKDGATRAEVATMLMRFAGIVR